MIDVIIPTYKRYDLLPETLKSVQTQTCQDWHCWISEDGEDPETAKCIQPFLVDKRFTHITGPHAGYPAAPRNRAILKGNGEFVCILDNDDVWRPEKLEKQLKFMATHPDCVMVGANAYKWRGGSQAIAGLPIYHEKIPAGNIDLKFLLRHGNAFIASATMIRRPSLEEAGLFNETLDPPIGEDIELWYRLAAVGELWFTEEPLILYRKHRNGKYYSSLVGQRLRNWHVALLQSVLNGTTVTSPYQKPQNNQARSLIKDQLHFLRSGPHLFGIRGYKLKKMLGFIPKFHDNA